MGAETRVEIGHRTLRLRDLMPDKSAAFSPNLFSWMRRRAHFYKDGGVLHGVFRVKPGTPTAECFGAGTLLIGYPINGYPGDLDFAGAKLMAVLCNGARENQWCFTHITQDLEPLANFWDHYLKIGRCAIDPLHQHHFVGDRFSVSGAVRTCLWCGHRQHKVVTPRVVHDESWVDLT